MMSLNTEQLQQGMNLAALQRVDSHILQIIDNASQVALYKFNQQSSEWEKTEIEGTFFIFLRSVSPEYGFIVMNRLSTTNLIETISADLEFQLQSPFLLYKNSAGKIYGIWFYDETECLRIEMGLNRLAQSQESKKKHQRQRCASEGDQKNKLKNKEKSGKSGTDILSLLSQAQEQYDKQQKSQKKEAPKEKKGEIIKPTPLRPLNGDASLTQGTSLNLETLFAQAKANQRVARLSPQQNKEVFPSSQPVSKPVDLQRLLSNPANTVEHIEKIQLNDPPRDRAASSSDGRMQQLLSRDRATSFTNGMGLKESLLNALLPGSSRDAVFSSEEVSYRVKACPPLMAPIVSPFSSPLVPIAASLADPYSQKPLLDDSPIITPAMLEESMEANLFDKDLNFSGLPSRGSLLVSPLVFTQPLSNMANPNSFTTNSFPKPNKNNEIDGDNKSMLALTKEHLKESLLYLLQNDDDFLSKVHEGYISSLKSQLTRFGKL